MKERAKRIGHLPAVGRGQSIVRCACGWKNAFYTWSWAGHGKAKCDGCGKWIRYQTLEIKEP